MKFATKEVFASKIEVTKMLEKTLFQKQSIEFVERTLFFKIDKWLLMSDRDKLSLVGTQLENEIKVLQNKYCSTKINY